MFNFREAKIKDFKRIKGSGKSFDLDSKRRVTFYRTKPGCYTPPPYELKFRKLSDVL